MKRLLVLLALLFALLPALFAGCDDAPIDRDAIRGADGDTEPSVSLSTAQRLERLHETRQAHFKRLAELRKQLNELKARAGEDVAKKGESFKDRSASSGLLESATTNQVEQERLRQIRAVQSEIEYLELQVEKLDREEKLLKE